MVHVGAVTKLTVAVLVDQTALAGAKNVTVDQLREMAREAEFVICVSDFSRELMAKTCPESADKIRRIYNGIELDDFPVAAPERAGPLRIISIGRLIEFKGFQILLDAVTALSGSGPAYGFYLIEAMVEAAQRMGLSAEQGREMAIQTVLRASMLAQQSTLGGTIGSRRVIKDRLGRVVEDIGYIREPRDGSDLTLSIDSKIQYIAFTQLQQAVEQNKAKAGGIVVLDVKTGEVLALANMPTYNPNSRAGRGERVGTRKASDSSRNGLSQNGLSQNGYIHTYIYTYVHTHTHTCMHVHIPVESHTCLGRTTLSN